MLTGLDRADIADHWDELAELIAKPLKKTETEHLYTPDDVLWKCVETDWQCWASVSNKIDCVFITYITPYPTGYKTFTVYLVGGHRIHTWLEEAWNLFKAYAKHNNCSEIIGMGREGWLRVLPKVEENEFRERLTFSVRID
jgi:hypothetical protein